MSIERTEKFNKVVVDRIAEDQNKSSRTQSTQSLISEQAFPVRERPKRRRARRPNRSNSNDFNDFTNEDIETVDNEKDEEITISIGIDLGTTFSGVAWALSTSPGEVNITGSWDSDLPRNSDLHKVPSELTYDSEGRVSSWGYKIDTRHHKINWFKLRLSDKGSERLKDDQPEKYHRLEKLFKRHGKEPVDVVADYLRCLWSHATRAIQSKIGSDLWNNVQLRIVLTVPAIWDHKAQELTKKAAEMAGILERKGSTLELIGEPEAAALSVFDEMRVQKKRCLQAGDVFVVCDAGGGTVDLISYKVEQVKPLRLAMISEATGDLCGAIFLDAAFEKQIRTMISVDDYENLASRAKRKMMNDWEHGIKRSFRIDAAEDEKWHVDIPGYLGIHVTDSEVGSNDRLVGGFRHQASKDSLLMSSLSLESLNRRDPGTLVLKTGHLHAIFSEVCSKIQTLVGTQLSVAAAKEHKEPAAILLVGGFGENIYLRQELDRTFNDVEIQQPTKAWAAICRGAVLKGLGNDVVVNHISKYNYGCVYNPDFVEGKHLEIDRKYEPIQGVAVAKNQLDWFLKRGENVEKKDPVKHDFFWPLAETSHLESLSVKIYYSDSMEAESRIESRAKLLCTLQMKFDPSVFDELPVFVNEKGISWRRLDYVVEMQVSSGEICWSAKYKDIEAGTIKTIVGYEGMANS